MAFSDEGGNDESHVVGWLRLRNVNDAYFRSGASQVVGPHGGLQGPHWTTWHREGQFSATGAMSSARFDRAYCSRLS